MNETSTILLMLILGIWFFTNSRSQALIQVIKDAKTVSPSISNTPGAK